MLIGGRQEKGSGEAATPYQSLEELERLVHDKIKRGTLFILYHSKYQGGPATGQPCDVCGQNITAGNEREVRGPRGDLHAHVICHCIWHRESVTLRRAVASGGV